VAGSALSPGRSELFHLSSRPTQLRRTHPMLLASQIDPRYVGSNHGQPFGFLIVVRLIILLVFSRFFDILLSAFRTRQPFPEKRCQSFSSARWTGEGADLSPSGRCRWRAFDPSADPMALEGAPPPQPGYAAARHRPPGSS